MATVDDLIGELAADGQVEAEGDFTARLALMEALKTMPSGAVWDAYCLRHDVPVGGAWLEDVRRYEREVLSRRGS